MYVKYLPFNVLTPKHLKEKYLNDAKYTVLEQTVITERKLNHVEVKVKYKMFFLSPTLIP